MPKKEVLAGSWTTESETLCFKVHAFAGGQRELTVEEEDEDGVAFVVLALDWGELEEIIRILESARALMPSVAEIQPEGFEEEEEETEAEEEEEEDQEEEISQ